LRIYIFLDFNAKSFNSNLSSQVSLNPNNYNQVLRKNINIEEKNDLFDKNDENKKNSEEDDEENEI